MILAARVLYFFEGYYELLVVQIILKVFSLLLLIHQFVFQVGIEKGVGARSTNIWCGWWNAHMILLGVRLVEQTWTQFMNE